MTPAPNIDSNPIYLTMIQLETKLQQMRRALIKFMIVYGPVGIAKTERVQYLLEQLDALEREKWNRLRNSQKAGHRRSIEDEDSGEYVYRPIWIQLGSKVTEPELYHAMYWTSQIGEFLFIDDANSMHHDSNSGLLMQATAGNGAVSYNVQKKIPRKPGDPIGGISKRHNFHGAIIIIDNHDKGNSQVGELFKPAVISRAAGNEVVFSRQRQHLFDFVYHTAFTTTGLARYLFAPTVLMQFNMKITIDERTAGLGFGLDEQGKPNMPVKERNAAAKQMLLDVRTFFAKYADYMTEISYRPLRAFMLNRMEYPDTWENECKKLLSQRRLPS